jgi:hypothetical protein
LRGADFALLQRYDVLTRAAVFVAFVIVVGEGEAATEQGGKSEGEDGFLLCHLANS